MEGVSGTFVQDLLQHVVHKEAVYQAYIQQKEDDVKERQHLANAVQSTRLTSGIMFKCQETQCDDKIPQIWRGIEQKNKTLRKSRRRRRLQRRQRRTGRKGQARPMQCANTLSGSIQDKLNTKRSSARPRTEQNTARPNSRSGEAFGRRRGTEWFRKRQKR